MPSQLVLGKIFAILAISLVLVIGGFPLTSNENKGENQSDDVGEFVFFSDYESWIESGYIHYGEFFTNKSFTTEVVVGAGERYETIQDALNDGYLCLYLKKQIFEISEPIVPPKEDLYITGSGAEIVAVQPMNAIFDIRNVRYVHIDGLFINGNGIAEKCIDASRTPSQVPVHQIRNCKIWGAKLANIDFTGCEDSLIFNCWIDGRKDTSEPPLTVTDFGLKIGEFGDGYRTGGQINLIHCLIGFRRKADVFAKNVAQLKLSNCLLSSKNMWSAEFEAHVIVEGGTGENPLMPTLELTNCWVENGHGGNVPNILIRNRPMSKLTVIGGMFYTDDSPNIYSELNPCAETITLIGAFFEQNIQYKGYNIAAPTQKLISLGNTYNWNGIEKTNTTTYIIYDKNDTQIETNTRLAPPQFWITIPINSCNTPNKSHITAHNS